MDEPSVSQYRILGKIAEGAQGVVYEALHLRMGRRVALKFLNREALLDEQDRRRFDREAKIAAGLDHSCICPIYDYDEVDGQVFLAMPLLEGRTLRALLQDGPLPLDDAVLIAIQVAEGLQEAHRHGIVHRDIKPSNIMVTGAGPDRLQAKIMDFGLARSQDMTAVTRTGTAVGTAAYMSPQQVKGEEVDGRTDIWSLGAVLYEMVAGRRAFPGDGHQAVLYGILHEKPVPVGQLRPQARPELRRIIGKALDRDPGGRYAQAADLLADLRALRREMTTPRGPVREWFWKYRNRICLVGAGLSALAIVVVGGLAALNRLSTPASPLGQPRQVTFAEEWEGEPALSPDGTRLAFAKFTGTSHDIFWVGIMGGEPVPIVTHPADDRSPLWLPDGSGLLFVSDRGGRTGIWRTDLSGRTIFLVAADACDPGISRDGSLLAFIRPDSTGSARVCVAPLQDPGRWRIVSGDIPVAWSQGAPSFSPEGSALCFTDDQNLWILPLNGDRARQLTTGGRGDAFPAWSADGRHVYFSAMRGGVGAIWRVPCGGGEPERLTLGSGPECSPSLDGAGRWLAYATQQEGMNVVLAERGGGTRPVTTGWSQSQQPALAPDASFVVYTAVRQEGYAALWRREVEAGVPTGAEKRLTDQPGSASHPTVSPDGRWIAYHLIAAGDNNREIWVVEAQGGTPARITEDPAPDYAPAWAPDGRRLAFCSEREGPAAVFAVEIREGRAVGAAARVTPRGITAGYPCWSPDGRRIAFLAPRNLCLDVWVTAFPPAGDPVPLTTGIPIHFIRWIPGRDEIWACVGRDDGGIVVCGVDPDGGGTFALEPPLPVPAGSIFGWFNTDADGRYAAMNENRHLGDIWVIEARSGRRF